MRRSRPIEPPDPSTIGDVALRLLSLRAHSADQLRRKLIRRGFEAAAVEAEIERLAARRWIDDAAWARQAARSRLRTRYGRRRVEQELEAAGVDSGTSREAIEEALEEEDEGARMREALARRLESLVKRKGIEHATSPGGRTKLAAHLLQRGYAPSDIIDAVDEALRELAHRADEPHNRRLDSNGEEPPP